MASSSEKVPASDLGDAHIVSGVVAGLQRTVEWPVPVRALSDAAEIALRRLLEVIDQRGRSGGALTARHGGVRLGQILCGRIKCEKIERYFRLSEEKATRLETTRLRGHRSSFESRDPQSDRLGGAIVVGDWILSFSGLTEESDTILCLLVAIRLRLCTLDESRGIAVAAGCGAALERCITATE